MMSRIPFKALRFGARFASSQRDGRTLYDFALYVPDVPNSAALRAKVRPIHLKNAAGVIASGDLRLGGKMVTPETMHLPSDKSQAVASLMIYKAESLEAARKLVEDDVYYTEAKNNNVQMSQAMVSRDNKMKRMSRRVTVMCPSSGSDVSSGLPCTIITMPRVSTSHVSPRHTPLMPSNSAIAKGPVRKHSVIELSSDDENIPRKPVAKRPKKPGAVCAEVLEISSDDEQPRPVSKHVVDQLSKLQHDYAKLQKDHEKEVTDLKAQLRLRQASSSSKLDPQDLEDHVCCEICTAKMWVPYMLDCGHAFCGQCLTDWFQTSLNNHHARYPTNPALVPMLNLLRTANPEQQHNIRRQFGHLLPPDVEYTCPTCRNKVHRKPIEAFALKALVRKVASAQGEESPRKEAAPIAGRSRKRGARAPPARSDPFSQFFP